METKTDLSPQLTENIRSVIHNVISQKIYSLVCGMDDNELRDEIRNVLFDKNILDGIHYNYENQWDSELPLTYRGSRVLTNELTDYLMKKFVKP